MRYGIVFLLSMVVITTVFAYRWPNDETRIISHFGQNISGIARRSLDLDGSFEEVFPVSEGVILFEHGADEDLFPTKSAKTVIMGNKDGINVVYAGLGEIVARPFQEIKEQDLLGRRAAGQPLSVAFYDYQVSQYVNPLVFLPERKFMYHSIILSGISLKSQDGTEYLIRYNTPLPAGSYEVFADVKELIGGTVLAPYQVELDFMGDIMAQITMDAWTARDGKGILKGKKVYSEANVYDEKGRFRLGRLVLIPGQSFITIRLSSINGLRRQEQFRLIATRS